MEDKIFGTLEFNVGWCKYETFNLWGKNQRLKIRLSSDREDKPNELQQKEYLNFKENVGAISTSTEKLVKELIVEDWDDITEQLGDDISNDIHDLVIPNQVLFFQSGKTALICESKWTDFDIVLLLGKEVTIDYGYQIEGEI